MVLSPAVPHLKQARYNENADGKGNVVITIEHDNKT